VADGGIEGSTPRAFRGLQPPDELFRILRKKIWLDDLHEAFVLRPFEAGLSVCYDCPIDRCIEVLPAPGLNTMYGVAKITVGQVLDLGLVVVPDTPNHALILGISWEEVDFVASRLAELAIIVDRTKRIRR
jgi:hypothetical protein